MQTKWANEFNEIFKVLPERNDIKEEMFRHIAFEPILGKAVEEKNRNERFKKILLDGIDKNLDFNDIHVNVKKKLGYLDSKYKENHRVFSQGWEARLLRTQISVFYNCSVLSLLKKEGQTQCFIPHSQSEERGTNCSKNAGKSHKIETLLYNLKDIYFKGNWDNKNFKLPDHPNCTHVVKPII